VRGKYYLILCILILTACKSNSQAECFDHYFTPEPSDLDSLPEINSDIKITLINEDVPIRVGDSVFIFVENLSRNEMIISLENQILILRHISDITFERIDDGMNRSLSPENGQYCPQSYNGQLQIILEP
jgi:hypothetical protein